MNTKLLKASMVTSLFAFLLCTALGIFDITMSHVGLGIFIMVLGATNLIPLWANWKRLKAARKELEA